MWKKKLYVYVFSFLSYSEESINNEEIYKVSDDISIIADKNVKINPVEESISNIDNIKNTSTDIIISNKETTNIKPIVTVNNKIHKLSKKTKIFISGILASIIAIGLFSFYKKKHKVSNSDSKPSDNKKTSEPSKSPDDEKTQEDLTPTDNKPSDDSNNPDVNNNI